MKNSIAIIVLVLMSTLSFSSGWNTYYSLGDRNESKVVTTTINGVALRHSAMLQVLEAEATLNSTKTIIYNYPDRKGDPSWISKTFRSFGYGVDLVGFNIKMNSFDLIQNSGWIHQKESQLNPEVAHNGLSLRFKF